MRGMGWTPVRAGFSGQHAGGGLSPDAFPPVPAKHRG
jgi:hypothetical protein